MNLAGLSGSRNQGHDPGMLDTDADTAHRSGMRPVLADSTPGTTTVRTHEERMARANLPEAERRAVRRGVAYARSVASDAGVVASAGAGVYAELRRVFGDDVPARV